MSDDAPLGRDEALPRVRARLLAAARAWLPHADAEDVTQDTMMLLSTKYAHVTAAEELVAIGVTAVHFKRVGHWRKVKRRSALGQTPVPVPGDAGADPLQSIRDEAPDPEAVAWARQRLSMLVDAAARLDGRCREILRRKLQGASFVEIATELGRPVNTIYSWDFRCHERLKRLLGARWGFVSGREEAR